jgi:peptidoglycan/LPS O-acetylase OafA/YrhL
LASSARSGIIAAPPMANGSERVHLGYLDGIRGWSALFVVFHHVWQFVIASPGAQPLPRWFSAMTIFKFGTYAVAIFIVLSGYCLMLAVARTPGAVLTRGIGDFVVRRARRILPPYYAALLLSIGLLLVMPALQRPTASQWDIALPAFSAGSLVTHFGLVHNVFRDWQWKINSPMWTVALEWQIYFLYAFLFLPVWRRLGPLMTLALAWTLAVVPIALGGGFAGTWFIGCFALGMYGAGVSFSPGERRIPGRDLPWAKLSAAGVLVVALIAALDRRWHAPAALPDTVVAFTAMAYIIATTRRLQQGGPRPRLMRFFAHPLSASLGAFSYSLYLIHFPLVAILYLGLRALHLSPVVMFSALCLVGVPLIIAVTYAFHRLFERPFMHTAREVRPPAEAPRPMAKVG